MRNITEDDTLVYLNFENKKNIMVRILYQNSIISWSTLANINVFFRLYFIIFKSLSVRIKKFKCWH